MVKRSPDVEAEIEDEELQYAVKLVYDVKEVELPTLEEVQQYLSDLEKYIREEGLMEDFWYTVIPKKFKGE